MSGFVALVARLEGLYESVVTSPNEWSDQRFAEWSEELSTSSGALDREALRQIRRGIRAAIRLRAFWLVDDTSRPDDHGDWRTRVDMSQGSRAWRPVVDLAMHGLDVDPSEELFDIVKDRFSVLTSQRWMEGVDYEAWRATR